MALQDMNTNLIGTPKMRAIASELIGLQAAMNQRVNQGWRGAGYAWHRAIWLESAELVDALPWKWWKAGGEVKLEQIRFEVVDILHFIISWACVEAGVWGNGDHGAAAWLAKAMVDIDCTIGSDSARVFESGAAIEAAEKVAAAAAAKSLHDTISCFSQLCCSVGLGSESLRRMYVGKNALNIVRNRLGYKDGTYVKMWEGEEDNVHLERLMAQEPSLDLDGLVSRLITRYGELNRG